MSGKSGFLGMLVEVKTVQKVLRLLTVISRVDGWLVETKKKKKKLFVQKFFHIDPVGCPRLSISRLVHKSTHSQQ